MTRERVYLQEAIPYIEDVTNQMLVLTQVRVFKALTAGTLTPQDALNAWVEVYTSHELMRKLRKQAIGEVSEAEQALQRQLRTTNSRT